MNATLPICLAQALVPFAPPKSVVHQIIKSPDLTESGRQRIDREMHADKLANGYAMRNFQTALALQIQAHPEQWRSA